MKSAMCESSMLFLNVTYVAEENENCIL